jgi:hypothetical protein
MSRLLMTAAKKPGPLEEAQMAAQMPTDQKISAQVAATTAAQDTMAMAEMLADRARAVGKYAFEHGQYIQQLSDDFALKLLAEARAHAGEVLAAERRKLNELERILGLDG